MEQLAVAVGVDFVTAARLVSKVRGSRAPDDEIT
jgi:hypothetical protein